MTNPRAPGQIYLRFLQLTDTIRDLPSLPPLDPLEDRILLMIARATQKDERLSVRDMMARHELGAPATIHNRLKTMREKGWIILADTDDTRRKQLALTSQALKHFDRLSTCLLKAVEGSK